jgi:hypothetical protein
VVEMALILPLLLLIIFGALTASLVLDRLLSVLQVVRYAGSMYARGTDFSVTSNKDLLLMGAGGLGITGTRTGVIYLSAVMRTIDSHGTPGLLVVAERFVIGNPSFDTSRIGTLAGTLNGPVPNFQTDPAALATILQGEFGAIRDNERIYVVEVSENLADLGGWTRSFGMNRFYTRALF